MSYIQILVIVVFTLTLVWAAYTDFRHLEISNRASILIAILFLPAAVMIDIPFTMIGLHYAYALAFLIVGAVLFTFGFIGGGDVKLLAAIIIWFDPTDFVRILMYILLLGGALALIMLIAQKVPRFATLLGSPPWLAENSGMKQPIPYGIAISLATLIMLERIPVLPPSMQNILNN